MKSLALVNKSTLDDLSLDSKEIVLDGRKLYFGYVETPDPNFDAERQSEYVLVKKRAFSCNFRDRAILMMLNDRQSQNRPFYSGFGSEFVAEIVEVGTGVDSLKIGDRVIPNAYYPNENLKNAVPGLPTNYASLEFEIFHQDKLLKLSKLIDDNMAAGLTIGTQTLFGMISRLELATPKNVLVTASTSNTSLFAISILSKMGHKVSALTTTKNAQKRLKELGAHKVHLLDKVNISSLVKALEIDINNGPFFDLVIDPFSDIYLHNVIHFMGYNSKYVTCGFHSQYSLNENYMSNKAYLKMLSKLLSFNITLIGNCLGSSKALRAGINFIVNNNVQIPVDSVFSPSEVDSFLKKSFKIDNNRFGKVIMNYV